MVDKWLAMLEPESGGVLETPAELTTEDETAIRAWLAHIGETDSDLIEGVLEQCRADPESLTYFLHRAEEVPAKVIITPAGKCRTS